MTVDGVGTLLACAEFWLLINADCEHEQYIPRNKWNYERHEIEAEVHAHYAACSLCHTPSKLV